MGGSRGQSKRSGSPARVLFFPKREGGRSKTPFEFSSPSHATLPEFSLEEPATEPFFITPFLGFDEEEQTATDAAALPAKKKSKRRKTGELKARRRITEEVARAIGWSAVEKKKSPYEGVSRQRAAELAVFGHKLFEDGRLDEARQVFEGLVATGLEDAFAHTMLGTIYLANKDRDRALALFEAALAIDPDDLAARVYRGEIRLAQGHARLALDDLKRVAAKGPKDDPFTDRAKRLLRLASHGSGPKR
jgi:tetratricopeptide (TPR) repeat protein